MRPGRASSAVVLEPRVASGPPARALRHACSLYVLIHAHLRILHGCSAPRRAGRRRAGRRGRAGQSAAGLDRQGGQGLDRAHERARRRARRASRFRGRRRAPPKPTHRAAERPDQPATASRHQRRRRSRRPTSRRRAARRKTARDSASARWRSRCRPPSIRTSAATSSSASATSRGSPSSRPILTATSLPASARGAARPLPDAGRQAEHDAPARPAHDRVSVRRSSASSAPRGSRAPGISGQPGLLAVRLLSGAASSRRSTASASAPEDLIDRRAGQQDARRPRLLGAPPQLRGPQRGGERRALVLRDHRQARAAARRAYASRCPTASTRRSRGRRCSAPTSRIAGVRCSRGSTGRSSCRAR